MQLRVLSQLVGASLLILLTACSGANAPVPEQAPTTKPAPAATEAAPPAAELAAVARAMAMAATIK